MTRTVLRIQTMFDYRRRIINNRIVYFSFDSVFFSHNYSANEFNDSFTW